MDCDLITEPNTRFDSRLQRWKYRRETTKHRGRALLSRAASITSRIGVRNVIQQRYLIYIISSRHIRLACRLQIASVRWFYTIAINGGKTYRIEFSTGTIERRSRRCSIAWRSYFSQYGCSHQSKLETFAKRNANS